MGEPLLSLSGLRVDFGAGRPAVDGLDLAVSPGEIVSLLGPSGCGKTTTMRVVAGLIVPQAGRVRLAGRDITALPPNKRGVGLVFQSYALFPHLSVFENVAFGLKLRKQGAERIGSRVAAMLEMVGLTGFEGRLPRELSGGQQQRVALARAVAIAPDLLLLDEPLSNLDARLRLDMRAELARIQRESGVTMLYVTHDQAEALALSTRIAVMADGRIEQLGTPEDVYAAPATAFVARFMGFETILAVRDGTLAGQAGVLGPAPGGASPGSALAWRPGQVLLGSGPYAGRVTAASFQGESVEYLLATAAGPVKAEAPAGAPRWREGETVAFDLPLSAAARLPSV
ncbi:MAG: ABC transporter ATP-binding protein [Burkholderiales bacterium]|jgi:putative spermidine/putrescine transport system ATP-binding protein|nr:ABC transporter ATP-binding protein [Burkholderiales bacterium]